MGQQEAVWTRIAKDKESWRTLATVDGGLPSSHRPEDLARSSHRTQKKKKEDSGGGLLPAVEGHTLEIRIEF